MEREKFRAPLLNTFIDRINQILPTPGLGELILWKSVFENPLSGVQSFVFNVFSSLSFNSWILL